MDAWDKLIEQAKETERCAIIARKNIEAHEEKNNRANGEEIMEDNIRTG